MKILTSVIGTFFIVAVAYGLVGTGERVDEIKSLATADIDKRGWEIMRYEGYRYGSYARHGGICYYHVRNKDDHSIQYRVGISLWGNELQYWYGAPEELNRVDLKVDRAQ